MEEIAVGIGMLLATFGPLLLLPLTWLLARYLVGPFMVFPRTVSPGGLAARLTAFLVSAAAVGSVMALSYFPGKLKFDELCAAHSVPRVSERVWVDGFYRTRLFPYEARQYLGEGLFSYVEGPDMYRKDGFVRYRKGEGDDLKEEKVSEPISYYGVRDVLETLEFGILLNEKTVYQIESGKELAKAAHLTYHGGPLSIFLGVYGMSSCPDIRSREGSNRFRTYYNLEKDVLQAPL